MGNTQNRMHRRDQLSNRAGRFYQFMCGHFVKDASSISVLILSDTESKLQRQQYLVLCAKQLMTQCTFRFINSNNYNNKRMLKYAIEMICIDGIGTTATLAEDGRCGVDAYV